MNEISPQYLVKEIIALGFTQAQIEEKTGVNQSLISRLLTGVHTNPRLSTVRALERFYLEIKNKDVE